MQSVFKGLTSAKVVLVSCGVCFWRLVRFALVGNFVH